MNAFKLLSIILAINKFILAFAKSMHIETKSIQYYRWIPLSIIYERIYFMNLSHTHTLTNAPKNTFLMNILIWRFNWLKGILMTIAFEQCFEFSYPIWLFQWEFWDFLDILYRILHLCYYLCKQKMLRISRCFKCNLLSFAHKAIHYHRFQKWTIVYENPNLLLCTQSS